MEDECPICLMPLSGSVTTVGCCRKEFHAECIIKCTQNKNECPMCRVQDCIVYIPEPEPEPAPVPDYRARAFVFYTVTFTIIVVSMYAIKNYVNI